MITQANRLRYGTDHPNSKSMRHCALKRAASALQPTLVLVMMQTSLRVVVLTGGDSRATRMSIESVCEIPGVVPVAVLLDTGQDSLRRRWRNLRRNVRREGWRYVPHRILQAVRASTSALVDHAVVTPSEVEELLRKAFPERCHTLDDLGRKYSFSVRSVGNLNGPEAVRALHECNADLGIVLGTRILKCTTFSIPRLGCINLHKGKVPEYRGMPPGFWELYDGAATAGVTVHFVDSKLDTGDIVATGEVEISPRETPDTLKEKLHEQGALTLARAVAALQTGAAPRIPQKHTAIAPRTKPTLKEVAALRKRLPQWRDQSDFRVILRSLFSLGLFYSGLYGLVRRSRKKSRAAILLYHRVNDFSRDVLTVGTDPLAAHLLAISKYYPTMASSELVASIGARKQITPTTVLIHFDDCYRDVHTNGRPILKAAGVPATVFISSGYMDTDRSFAHDVAKYAFRFENSRQTDIHDWIAAGFEIGSHTVNHVDLGKCNLEEAECEVFQSKVQLQSTVARPVSLFSFPFGSIRNIREDTRDLVRQAGYSALFSAHGGFVGADTDIWDIPRIGVSSSTHHALWLLMEIEGLTPSGIVRRLKQRRSAGSQPGSWQLQDLS
jgi:peptidoglycan/xylan/chitin deacetylase (PgdA/CDA1 family)